MTTYLLRTFLCSRLTYFKLADRPGATFHEYLGFDGHFQKYHLIATWLHRDLSRKQKPSRVKNPQASGRLQRSTHAMQY